MSTSCTPVHVHDVTTDTSCRSGSMQPSSIPQQGTRGKALSPVAISLIGALDRSGKWSQWLRTEPRLAGFTSLEEAVEGWGRRDPRCYQVVAGLTALGSRRGGDDNDAALAVVVLLEEGIVGVAWSLSDVCDLDDVNAAVWEMVKAAEPQLGSRAAEYLLKRARQRLTRPAAGMVARLETTSLDQRLGWDGEGAGAADQDRDLLIALPAVEDPVDDLADLLIWAREVGAIATEEIHLLVELLAADNDGMPREAAQRLAGKRRGVDMRTIRRRRDATEARLREAAPMYLAATA